MTRNTSPSELAPQDEDIIRRLISALDELVGSPSANDELLEANRAASVTALVGRAPRRGSGSWRTLAGAAAALALVGGVGVVVSQQLRNRAPTPAAAPDTVPDSTTPSPVAAATPRFTLPAADFAPGTPVEVAATELPGVTMAWRLEAPSPLLLTVRVADTTPGELPAGAVTRQVGDVTLIGQLVGDPAALAPTTLDDLLAELQPGSGLPWVLPLDGWEFVAIGDPAVANLEVAQPFVGVSEGLVTIRTGPYVDQLSRLALPGAVTNVTVAGADGWRVDGISGAPTVVVWQVPDSNLWTTMTFDLMNADTVDRLLAIVIDVAATTPAQSVAPPG